MTWGITIPPTANFALRIEGTLRFFNDTKSWPSSDTSCIAVLKGSSFVALYGSGTVDGQGQAWWPCAKQNCFRPGLVNVQGTTDLLVANLTFLNSPNHVLELYATPFEVVGVTILAPPSTGSAPSHNTDGIDVHGNQAYIHDSVISTGDDHVAMHANDTLVERMVFGTGHGASIGSLGPGTYLQNITVRDSSMTGGVQAIRIKADSDSSGFLRDVLYKNLTLKNCGMTIQITTDYGSELGSGSSSTMEISNVSFEDITASGSTTAGQFGCSSSAPCKDITVADVVHVAPLPATGWSCQNAHGTVSGTVTPSLTCLSPDQAI